MIVTQKIHLPKKTIEVAYARDFGVVYAIRCIFLNIGDQIIMDYNDFLRDPRKGPFLLRIVSKLCRQVGVPEKPNDMIEKMDIPIHPLSVRATLSQKRKKRKTDGAECSRAVGGPWSR